VALVFYISHPQVQVDSDIPVPRWHLSDIGRSRISGILGEPWVANLTGIVSSAETKAIETAELIAGPAGLAISVRAQTGEIDRSSTGYVPHDEHEAIADELFANPERSARGWERAVDAQQRITGAVDNCLGQRMDAGDIAFVGHGGVGTLLLCAIKGNAIDRKHDQPGGGHVFAFDRRTRAVLFDWVPLEDVSRHLANG
jgi:broad specificity phosphatase PhoE